MNEQGKNIGDGNVHQVKDDHLPIDFKAKQESSLHF